MSESFKNRGENSEKMKVGDDQSSISLRNRLKVLGEDLIHASVRRKERSLRFDSGRKEKGDLGFSLGLALRMFADVAIAPIACAGIGWMIDEFFGWTPIVTFLLFTLGFVSGVIEAARFSRRWVPDLIQAQIEEKTRTKE